VNIHKGALWTRLYVPKPNDLNNRNDVYQSSNAVYFLYYPHTDYNIISTHKTSIQEYLLQVWMGRLSKG